MRLAAMFVPFSRHHVLEDEVLVWSVFADDAVGGEIGAVGG